MNNNMNIASYNLDHICIHIKRENITLSNYNKCVFLRQNLDLGT